MTAVVDLDADVVELVACPARTAAPLREIAFRADAWLPDEDRQLRELFAADVAIAEIAATIGRGFHAVRARIDLIGLRRNSSRAWTDEEDAELVSRYRTVTCAQLALELGRSVPAVYARANLLAVSEFAAPDYDGWEDAQIRAGYASGVPVSQIAALIGRPFLGVRSRAYDLGVRHAASPPGWSEEEVGRALELAHGGARYLAIIDTLVDEGFPRRSKIGFGLKLRALGYGRGWGRAWTDDEDELLRRAYAAGDSLTPVLERLGRTRSSIRWRVEHIGLQGSHARRDGFRQGPVWSAEDDERLRAEYGKVSTPDLAVALGRKPTAVLQRAATLGIKHGYIRMFTPDERRAIGIAWRRGLSLTDLAAALGRDPAVVGKQAARLGLSLTSPDRPVRPRRGPRNGRVSPSLAEILALEAPNPNVDDPIERRALENDQRAARNRGASARQRKGRVMGADGGTL